MTTTSLDMSRPGVHAGIDARFSANPLAPLLRKWTERQLYRRTFAELSALSIRQREDIGFAGHDIAEIARTAARNL